jgi:hypothetical protein
MESTEPGPQADDIDRRLRRAWRRLYIIWAACTVTLAAMILLS